MHTTPFLDLASSFFKCHQIKMLNSHWSIAPVSSDSRLFYYLFQNIITPAIPFGKFYEFSTAITFIPCSRAVSLPVDYMPLIYLHIFPLRIRDPNATVVHTEENNRTLPSGEPLTNFTIKGHKINSSRNRLVSTNWQPREPISPRASQPQHRFKVTL